MGICGGHYSAYLGALLVYLRSLSNLTDPISGVRVSFTGNLWRADPKVYNALFLLDVFFF